MLETSLGRFRFVALLEGISYLILLGIAMPMKYYMEMPMMVKVVGWIHGLLFIGYLYALLQVWMEHKWSFLKVLVAFIVSLIPFGAFILDLKLKQEQQALNN